MIKDCLIMKKVRVYALTFFQDSKMFNFFIKFILLLVFALLSILI